MKNLLFKHWYEKTNVLLTIILLPLSYIFNILVILRRYLYKLKILKTHKLPVPVVIIGNITVGGVGKTPITKHIAEALMQHDIPVGVILRGYKAKNTDAKCVNKSDSAINVGDEALIYAEHNIPVAIGKNRYQAGLCLLKKYPNIQIILSDDGMQHYALYRNYEIAIVNYDNIKNNLYLLPMGSLRENICRLNTVNHVIYVNKNYIQQNIVKCSTSTVYFKYLENYTYDKQHKLYSVDEFKAYLQKTLLCNVNNIALKTLAIAGIGNPKKFFEFITQQLNIKLNNTVAFNDHHEYKLNDLSSLIKNYDIILTTEKDYAKIKALNINLTQIWVVHIDVSITNEQSLINDILNLTSLT